MSIAQAAPVPAPKSPRRTNERRTNEERGLDAHMSPPEAIRALALLEPDMPEAIADPCCGTGIVCDVLRNEFGRVTFGADIANYGWPHTMPRDYLDAPVIMNDTGIVTNPPYRWVREFWLKAIDDGTKYHAWICKLNVLASLATRRIFDKRPPARIWISSRRLPPMHQFEWTGPTCSSNADHCWIVWDERTEPKEPTRIGWFDWQELEKRANPASAEPPRRTWRRIRFDWPPV